jgi:hypothetical protein
MDEKEPIPKVIYMCHKELTHIKEYSKNWKRLNPEYEIKLYDNKLCEDFLLKEYSQLHYDIFKFIKDGPIKADFWRVCVIHKYGGVYVDADIEPLVPLREFIETDSDFVTCIDFTSNNLNPHIIVSRKNEEILKKCIDTYIGYYENKFFYEYCNWSITIIMFNIFITDVFSYDKKEDNKIKQIIKKYSKFGNYFNSISIISNLLLDSVTLKNYFKVFIIPLINKNESIFIIKNNKKYQFIKEIWNENEDISKVYCVYKNRRVLNNRYVNYNPNKHKFNK